MQKQEYAVSPVVGVMLLLVVTIIIAAIVSAFAGGVVSGTTKPPQATVQATYSQSTGMTITNSGGDAIPLASTTVLVNPTKAFGLNNTRFTWVVNKSYVLTGSGQTWATARAFLPGDTATITQQNLTYVQQRPDMGGENDYTDPNIGFANSNNLGLTFQLQFQDSSGKTIGLTTVTIAR